MVTFYRSIFILTLFTQYRGNKIYVHFLYGRYYTQQKQQHMRPIT